MQRKIRNEQRLDIYLSKRCGLTKTQVEMRAMQVERNVNNYIAMLIKRDIQRSRIVNG